MQWTGGRGLKLGIRFCSLDLQAGWLLQSSYSDIDSMATHEAGNKRRK